MARGKNSVSGEDKRHVARVVVIKKMSSGRRKKEPTAMRPIETIETKLFQHLGALSLIESFAFAARIKEYVINRAIAKQAELHSEELWAPERTKVRHMLARELDSLPFEHSFPLVGELLVYVCLDGERTVEDFEGVLDHMRMVFAQCKGEADQKPS